MDAYYFKDTDTLFLVFNQKPVAETRDLDGDGAFVADLDSDGGFVSLTVERAAAKMNGDRVALPQHIADAARQAAGEFVPDSVDARAGADSPRKSRPGNSRFPAGLEAAFRFSAPLEIRAT